MGCVGLETLDVFDCNYCCTMSGNSIFPEAAMGFFTKKYMCYNINEISSNNAPSERSSDT